MLPLSPHGLNRRLWRAGAAVGLFIGVAALWLVLVSPGLEQCARKFGLDFLAFYTAGAFVREGRFHDLYDLHQLAMFQQEVARGAGLDLGEAIAPWWNPPLYAWLFAPLSALPFRTALTVWTSANLAATALAIVLLCRMISPRWEQWRTWGLVPLLVLASAPFTLALTHGQSTGSSLLILTVAVLAWRQRRALWAGIVLGLLSYKPQLTALVAVVLVLDLGWRAAAGLGLAGATLLVLTMTSLPGTLPDYLSRLPENLHTIQVEQPYLWERHVTFKAFWRLLLQGREVGPPVTWASALTLACTLALAGLLAWAAVRVRSEKRQPDPLAAAISRDRLIAATVVTTPLLMPFYFDYDLLLLSIPAVLLAVECIPAGADWRASGAPGLVLIGCWSGLFLWLWVNPYIAISARTNLAVILLAGLAGLHLMRVRQPKSSRVLRPPETVPLFRAA